MDDFCNSFDTLAARTGNFVYSRRFHPYITDNRRRSADNQADSGPESIVNQKKFLLTERRNNEQ